MIGICKFCGEQKTDASAPDLGCEACERAIDLYTRQYHYACTDAEDQEIEEALHELSLAHPSTYVAMNDLQDIAVEEAKRQKRQEIAYHEFLYGETR
jgi:hypothetical protein